jgi:hypothetical protein
VIVELRLDARLARRNAEAQVRRDRVADRRRRSALAAPTTNRRRQSGVSRVAVLPMNASTSRQRCASYRPVQCARQRIARAARRRQLQRIVFKRTHDVRPHAQWLHLVPGKIPWPDQVNASVDESSTWVLWSFA